MNNNLEKENLEEKTIEVKKVETIVITGVKPFGADTPIPNDRKEIKRQLGFIKIRI